jgi:hypothetical protein
MSGRPASCNTNSAPRRADLRRAFSIIQVRDDSSAGRFDAALAKERQESAQAKRRFSQKAWAKRRINSKTHAAHAAQANHASSMLVTPFGQDAISTSDTSQDGDGRLH